MGLIVFNQIALLEIQERFLFCQQGCIKFPAVWYFFPPPFFLVLDILPRKFRPLPLFSTWYSSQQPKHYRKIILLYLSLFSCSILPHTSPLHNLNFLPNTLDKLPPGGGGLYTPLLSRSISWFQSVYPSVPSSLRPGTYCNTNTKLFLLWS